VKLLGFVVDHTPPSGAKVKKRIELYLFSPSGPSWPVLERTLSFTFTQASTLTGDAQGNGTTSSPSLILRDSPQNLLDGRHSVFQQWLERGSLKSQIIIQSVMSLYDDCVIPP